MGMARVTLRASPMVCQIALAKSWVLASG
jgi:hypothetical protein